MQEPIFSANKNPSAEIPLPQKLRKRIGATTYEVSIHFSETNKETFEDKILRLIKREAQNV